jgi:hypothetical protein
VDQELLTLPEHLSSPPVFSGVRVTRSFALYVCFVDRYCSFVLFRLAIVLLHNHPLSNLFHLEKEEEHRGHDHVIFLSSINLFN